MGFRLRIKNFFKNKERPIGKEEFKEEKHRIAPLVARTKVPELKKLARELKKIRASKYKDKFKTTRVWTGIKGLDKLLLDGIPKGVSILVAGGTGTGKTIMNLQIMHNALKKGLKCLFITLEESEKRLIEHMYDFDWDADKYIENGLLYIVRLDPFGILRSIDALLAKAQGELYVDIDPVILPEEFKKPDMIFVDSLSAIAAGFAGKEETYRIYIEQFFRYLEETEATSFLVTETEQIPKKYSPTGTEEFLADGVIVLYNFKKGIKTYKALEILKLRGAYINNDIVNFTIKPRAGIVVKAEPKVKIGF